MKDGSMRKAIREIRDQSGTDFIYDPQYLRNARPVTVQFKDIPLEQALQQLFENQPFTYELFNSSIIIKPALQTTDLVQSPEQAKRRANGLVGDPTGIHLHSVSVVVKRNPKLETT